MDRLSDKLREYLSTARGRTVYLKDIRTYLKVEPGSKDDQNLRVLMSTNLVKDHTVKPSGLADGGYKVIIPIDPIKFSLDGDDREGLIDFKFPRSYVDDTTFGIEDLVEVFQGDMIGIFGETNFGKSCIAYNILAMNLDLMPCVLMGNELTTSQNQIAPKIKRRLRRMEWAKWNDDNGKPRFDILPVGADYEEYIRTNAINVIDWITLPGEYYLIDSVLKSQKDRVGNGVLVPVLQKKKNVEDPEGGERARRHCDVELRIDAFGKNESLLTIGKVKAPKGKSPTGRMWGFDIVDYGANLANIREVVKCTNCWGKGYTGSGDHYKRCQSCEGRKYIDKEPKPVEEAQ